MTINEYWQERAWEALRQADAKERVTAMCCLKCALAILNPWTR
jgi:hypothetical protein